MKETVRNSLKVIKHHTGLEVEDKSIYGIETREYHDNSGPTARNAPQKRTQTKHTVFTEVMYSILRAQAVTTAVRMVDRLIEAALS